MRAPARAAALVALLLLPLLPVVAAAPEESPGFPYDTVADITDVALAAEAPLVLAPVAAVTGSSQPPPSGVPTLPTTGSLTQTYTDMAVLRVGVGHVRNDTTGAPGVDLGRVTQGRAFVAASRDGTAFASLGPGPGQGNPPTLFYSRQADGNFSNPPYQRNFTLEGALRGLAISDDGRRVVAATQVDRNVSLRGYGFGGSTLESAFDLRAPGDVYALATDGAASRIYLGGVFPEGNASYGGIVLYPFAQAEPLASWYDRSANNTNLTSLAASRSSSIVAAAGSDGRLFVYANAHDGLPEPTMLNVTLVPSELALSDDGRRGFAAVNKTLQSFTTEGTPALSWNVTVPGATLTGLATNATGGLALASTAGSGGGVYGYAETGGEPVVRILGDARGVDVSADGSTIAYALRSQVHAARLPRAISMDLVGGGKSAPTRMVTVPGSVSYEVNVRNDGAAPETIVFEGGAAPEVTVSAQPGTLVLRPGAVEKVNLTVSGTRALVGARAFNVTARAISSGAVDNVTLSIEPQPTLDVKFVANRTEVVAIPGETSTVLVAIVNNGTSDVPVTVTAQQTTPAGQSPWNLSVPETSYIAVRGTRSSVRVMMTPPADAANGSARSVTLTLQGPEVFDQVSIFFRINPNVGVEVNATGLTKFIEPGKRATYNVTVTNTGSLPRDFETFYELVEGSGRSWAIDIPQSTFRLEPNGKRVIAVSILAPADVQPDDRVTVRVSARSVAGALNETIASDNATLYGIAVAPRATTTTPTGNGIPAVAPLAIIIVAAVAARLLKRRPE